MTFWDFVASHRRVLSKKNARLIETDNEYESDEKTFGQSEKYRFLSGHPNFKSHSHQARKRNCWPIYRAQRLPDLVYLNVQQNETSDRESNTERSAKRELYAQGALIMFKPFRSLDDLLTANDTTWWSAYLRVKCEFDANKK